MKLEQAIEKAIVGRWDDCGFISSSNFPNGWCAVRVTLGGYVAIQRTRNDGTPGRWSEIGKQDKILLDPLFWQSLGKALGWENESECPLACCGGICPINIPMWQSQWHRFISHLSGGGTIGSFFENIEE